MQLTVTTEDDNIVSVDVDPGTVVENLKVMQPVTLLMLSSRRALVADLRIAAPGSRRREGTEKVKLHVFLSLLFLSHHPPISPPSPPFTVGSRRVARGTDAFTRPSPSDRLASPPPSNRTHRISSHRIISLHVARQAILEAETDIPSATQVVVFNGRELQNNDVLSACGVGNCDLIMVLRRPAASAGNPLAVAADGSAVDPAAFQRHIRADAHTMQQLLAGEMMRTQEGLLSAVTYSSSLALSFYFLPPSCFQLTQKKFMKEISFPKHFRWNARPGAARSRACATLGSLGALSTRPSEPSNHYILNSCGLGN